MKYNVIFLLQLFQLYTYMCMYACICVFFYYPNYKHIKSWILSIYNYCNHWYVKFINLKFFHAFLLLFYYFITRFLSNSRKSVEFIFIPLVAWIFYTLSTFIRSLCLSFLMKPCFHLSIHSLLDIHVYQGRQVPQGMTYYMSKSVMKIFELSLV